jgi:hypothetical protein
LQKLKKKRRKLCRRISDEKQEVERVRRKRQRTGESEEEKAEDRSE